MATSWTCARCAAQNAETAVSCQTCGFIRGGVVATPGPAAPPAPPAPSADALPASSPVPAQGGWPAGESIPDGSVPPPVPGAPAPGGWPGAPVSAPPANAKKQVATGILANVGIRVILIVGFIVVAGIIGYVTTAGRNASGQIDKAGDLQAADLQVGDCFDIPGETESVDPSAKVDKTTAMPCTQAHHYEVFYRGTMTDTGSYPTDAEFQAFSDSTCAPAFAAYVGTQIDQSTLTYYVFFPLAQSWAQGDRGIQCSLADPNHKTYDKSLKGSGY